MHIYRFLTNSNIQRVELNSGPICLNNLSLSLANPMYNKSKYVVCCSTVDNLFLVLHPDNNDVSKYNQSSLSMNLAIHKYFRNSPFIGDAFLVKLTEHGEISNEDWHHSLLNRFGMKFSPDRQLVAECIPL